MKYIAAVSGGPDSMAMLHMYRHQIECVCHVNYNKRRTSRRDKKIVKMFCKNNKIDFYCKNISALFYVFHRKENFQNLARKVRYDFFQKIAKKRNNYKVFVAHTLNDFVETAFIQKRKKTQTLFFGIKKNIAFKDILIHRPLIDFKKEDLIEYCKKNEIIFGMDETNDLEIYERNRIRKEIEKWAPETFDSFVTEIKKHNLKNKTTINLSDKSFVQWKRQKYNNSFFNGCSGEIKNELIKKIFQEHGVNYHSKEKFEQVTYFIEKSTPNKVIRLGNKTFIKKQKNDIIIIDKK